MEYILRIAVHESEWRRQLQEAIGICQKTPIREVMLMEESHQIMTSAFPMEKHSRMVEIYRIMAQEFRSAGIRFSINLVTCIGHGDNEVPRRLQLPFERFVGHTMTPAKAVYCISDPEWVAYTAEVCKRYAQATHPVRMMVDDDFRSLNHSTSFGCFCPRHAALTSRKLGYEVTGEQIRDAACGMGEKAEEIRKAWMQVNAEAQEAAASAIGKAIHSVSPETQVGLMNSGEPAHSVQGRDMNRLLRAFADGGQCLSRPLGGAYSDGLYETITAMVSGMSLSMAAVQEDTFWVSEAENYPNSPYTKSETMTRLQLKLHTLAGASALSLNFFDYLATPMPLQPQYPRAILAADEAVQKIEALRKDKQMTGIGLPWHPETAAYLTNRSHTPDGMLPQRPMDTILPLLGIPVQFKPAKTNVILGDAVCCYSRSELEQFLSGGLLIDAVAAEHLESMGLGHLLGCQTAGKITGPCVEQIADPEFGGVWTGTLMCTNWEAVARRGEQITRLIADQDSRVICRLLDEEKNELAPSMVFSDNELGGRVCVMAVPVESFCWLNCGHAQLIRELMRRMPGTENLPILTAGDHIAPFYYTGANGENLLGLVNCGLDPQIAGFPEGMKIENALDSQDERPESISGVDLKICRVTN